MLVYVVWVWPLSENIQWWAQRLYEKQTTWFMNDLFANFTNKESWEVNLEQIFSVVLKNLHILLTWSRAMIKEIDLYYCLTKSDLNNFLQTIRQKLSNRLLSDESYSGQVWITYSTSLFWQLNWSPVQHKSLRLEAKKPYNFERNP